MHLFYRSLAVVALLSSLAVAQARPINVVASFSIIGDMVQNVGAQHIRLTTLVGADGDAHVYRPTPADAKALAQAEVVFLNGIGFEGWMERLLGAVAYQGKVVILSEGVELLTEAEEHGEGEHGEGGHDHGRLDPHAWQDLSNAKVYVANIVKALVTVDPPNEASYRQAASAYTERLDRLDLEIRKRLAAIPEARRQIVTSHNAFAYFGAAYGVEFFAPIGLGTEVEPAAADIAHLIRHIKQTGITDLLVENITDSRLLERIAEETGTRLGGVLYSDALSGPDGPAATYLDMFRHNVELLLKVMR